MAQYPISTYPSMRGTESKIRPVAPPDVSQLAALSQRLTNVSGLVLSGTTTLAEAVRQAATASGTGAAFRIIVGAGTWEIPPGGLTISVPNLTIIGMGGNLSKFSRTGTPTDQGLVLSGQSITISGIHFSDANSTAYECVEVTGAGCVVQHCIFDDVYGAVIVSSADYVRVQDNFIQNNSKPDAIELAGTTAYSEVSGNIIV